MIKFVVPEVEAKYTSARETDPHIHIPGLKGTGWAGRLSTITPAAAEKLIQDPKQNLIQLKPTAEKPAVVRNINKPRSTDTETGQES